MSAAYRWDESKKSDRELNAGLGRSGLNRQGKALTPDDIDRNDYYQDEMPHMLGIDKAVSIMITVIAATGFGFLLTLLWWVGQP